MQLRKILGAFVTVLTACLAISAPAQAQFDPMVDFHTPGSGTAITFTSDGGSGGTLVTNAGGTLISLDGSPLGNSYTGDAYLKFGPLTQIAGSGVLQSSGKTTAMFSAGSFEIWSGANSTGTLLLRGSFGASEFIGRNIADLSIDFGAVEYDTSTLFAQQFLAEHGKTAETASIIGNLGLRLTSISPSPIGVNSQGGLNNFTAKGFVGSMDAMAVPEPGEYAVMGMAGLTMCGLIIRARRRGSVSRLAS